MKGEHPNCMQSQRELHFLLRRSACVSHCSTGTQGAAAKHLFSFLLKADSFGLYRRCGSLLSNAHSFAFRSFGPSFPHLDWLVPVSVHGSCGTRARTDSPGPETFQCYHTRNIRRMQSLLIIRQRIGARSESVVCLDYLHLNPHLRRRQVGNSETLSSPSVSRQVNSGAAVSNLCLVSFREHQMLLCFAGSSLNRKGGVSHLVSSPCIKLECRLVQGLAEPPQFLLLLLLIGRLRLQATLKWQTPFTLLPGSPSASGSLS